MSSAGSLPNLITYLRVALAAVFPAVIFLPGSAAKAAALAIFLAAAFTDWLDGTLARRMKIVSAFGSLIDPIADKLLVLAAVISFVQMALIPAWMAVVIVARDLVVTGLRLTMPPAAEKSVAARASGKWKTAIQFTVIIATLLFLIAREAGRLGAGQAARAQEAIYWSFFGIVLLTLWSGAEYLYKNRGAIGGR